MRTSVRVRANTFKYIVKRNEEKKTHTLFSAAHSVPDHFLQQPQPPQQIPFGTVVAEFTFSFVFVVLIISQSIRNSFKYIFLWIHVAATEFVFFCFLLKIANAENSCASNERFGTQNATGHTVTEIPLRIQHDSLFCVYYFFSFVSFLVFIVEIRPTTVEFEQIDRLACNVCVKRVYRPPQLTKTIKHTNQEN